MFDPYFSHNTARFPQRLEETERLLADKAPWPAFLHAGLEMGCQWGDCPEAVGEALEWMASAAVGLLDIASVGPLTPVCTAFATLIEAAGGAIEKVKNLKELVTWCTFLVDVFIGLDEQAGMLKAVTETLNEFVSITGELEKHVKVVAARSKLMALIRRKKDNKTIASLDDKLRDLMTDIRAMEEARMKLRIRKFMQETAPSRPIAGVGGARFGASDFGASDKSDKIELMQDYQEFLAYDEDGDEDGAAAVEAAAKALEAARAGAFFFLLFFYRVAPFTHIYQWGQVLSVDSNNLLAFRPFDAPVVHIEVADCSTLNSRSPPPPLVLYMFRGHLVFTTTSCIVQRRQPPRRR